MQTMNYKEAARYLKVTEGTLRNWVSRGRIQPRKVGKHDITDSTGPGHLSGDFCCNSGTCDVHAIV